MAFSSGKKWVKKYDPKSKEAFKLSRSKIDMFIECPRCFYLDRRLGVGRPASFPFNLNSAVDFLLKKEFDGHRAKASSHPLMTEYKIDAIPFAHAEMDTWRENFVGVQYHHEPTNLLIFGAVDDVWVNPKGELIVVDYKSTSKDGEVNLDAEWQDGYKRQMEVYQWLLRKRGFDVADTGYFVYANATKDRAAFDAKLEFNIKVIPYTGNPDWVDDTLLKIKACLDSDDIPKEGAACEYCRYRTDAGNAFKEHVLSHKAVKETKETKPKKK